MTETASAPRVARSSAIIGMGTLLSRITGFLRVSALVALGASRLTDVYNLANSTPNIVYELLLGGILTATLVPLFVESHERDDPGATDAINTVAIVMLVAGTVVGVVAAPWIFRAYVDLADVHHGVSRTAQITLGTDLLRWFMPQMLFYGITALATAMLNARRRFAAAAFAPALNNIVVITMLLVVGRIASATPTPRSVLDDPVLVLLLGLGTTAGVIAMTLVLLPALRRAGTGFRWRWEPRHPAVRTLARLSSWTVGYVATNQLAFIVVLVLAYRHDGDATLYFAAFTFFQLPHGLLAVSVMTALGPELASRHQAGDRAGLRDHFGRGLNMILIVMIPAAVGLAVLATPLITALLAHGKFNHASVTETANTLRAFAVGLVGFSVYLYVIRVFSSMKNTRVPFFLNLIENGVNVATAFLLYEWRGVEGLAWSWTVAYFVGAIVALGALRVRLVRLGGRSLVSTAVRVSVATIPAALAAVAVTAAMGSASPSSAVVTLLAATAAGGALFVGCGRLVGFDLIALLRGIVRREDRSAALPDA
ncbi:MAG: murein biosynthesis integral membrane protein MurJ [Acidimicrobiia bacterium]